MMKDGKGSISVQDLVKGAFLAAISIVLTRFLSFVYLKIIRVGFGSIPIMISGLLFGPLIGGITGVVADLIGVLINAQGTPHIGFVFTSALEGIIPGVLAIYYKRNPKGRIIFTFKRVFLAVFTIVMGSSLILNTLWLSQLFGTPYMIVLKPRIVLAIIMLPIHSFLIYKVIKNSNENNRS